MTSSGPVTLAGIAWGVKQNRREARIRLSLKRHKRLSANATSPQFVIPSAVEG